MKARVFLIHTGYVESNSTGTLLMWHPDGFDSVEEGLTSLGEFFRLLVEDEEGDREERSTRCPHCQAVLSEPAGLGIDDIENRVGAVLEGEIDGSGSLYDIMAMTDWNVGASEDIERPWLAEAVIVLEHGGTLLGMMAFPGTRPDRYFPDDWAQVVRAPEGMACRKA